MCECVYKRTPAADTSVSDMNAFTYATEVWGRRSLLSCKRRVSLLDDSVNVSAHARPGFSDTFKHKRTLDHFLLHQLKPAETHLCVLTFVTYIKDLEVVAKQCIMDLERRLMCPPC